MFSATRLTLDSNGLEDECSGETSTACKAANEAKPKKQTKDPIETKTEEIPSKKKKKKRKLVQTVDSPGNTTVDANIYIYKKPKPFMSFDANVSF